MNKKRQVAYYAWAENKMPASFARLAETGFYSCILVPLDAAFMKEHGVRYGGSPTAAALIVDLGEASADVAKFMLEKEPRHKGRIFLIGSESAGIAVPPGAALVSPDGILQAVRTAVQ